MSPKDSLDDLFPSEEEQNPGAEGWLALGVGKEDWVNQSLGPEVTGNEV